MKLYIIKHIIFLAQRVLERSKEKSLVTPSYGLKHQKRKQETITNIKKD